MKAGAPEFKPTLYILGSPSMMIASLRIVSLRIALPMNLMIALLMIASLMNLPLMIEPLIIAPLMIVPQPLLAALLVELLMAAPLIVSQSKLRELDVLAMLDCQNCMSGNRLRSTPREAAAAAWPPGHVDKPGRGCTV